MSGVAALGFRDLTLGDAVRAAARRNPHRVAVRGETGARTYRELTRRMAQVAATAGALCGPDGRAAILAPNCIEYLEVCLGIADAGLAIATPSPRLSTAELAAILEDSAARVLFVHPTVAETGRAALALMGDAAPRMVELGADYEALLAQASERASPAPISETTTFCIPYTSGTTGKPKGVLLSHRSRVLTAFATAAEFGCFGPDDDFLAIAPLSHGAGFAFALAAVLLGATCTLMEAFEPEATLRAMTGGAHTGVFLVPTHFHKIFTLPEALLDRHRGGGRLRAILSNAAPLPQSTKAQIVAHFGDGLLHEMYGSTETGIVTNLRPPLQMVKTTCVGTPFPLTEVELRDEAGEPAPDGAPAELFCRSPYLFNGYHGRPAETAETLKPDGWASVGDIAVRDGDGCYYIVDRKKDMVISGGLNVYPREVENVIDALPGVVESAVVGAPDPQWGERLVAFVVRRADTDVKPEAVASACRNRLAGYKTPREVIFVDTLPRNANGKVLKAELRVKARALSEPTP